MENYATTLPAFRPAGMPATAGLRTRWACKSTLLRSQDTSVRIQLQVDAVPSLADGRGAVAGVMNHDATAKSGPPRGEPR